MYAHYTPSSHVSINLSCEKVYQEENLLKNMESVKNIVVISTLMMMATVTQRLENVLNVSSTQSALTLRNVLLVTLLATNDNFLFIEKCCKGNDIVLEILTVVSSLNDSAWKVNTILQQHYWSSMMVVVLFQLSCGYMNKNVNLQWLILICLQLVKKLLQVLFPSFICSYSIRFLVCIRFSVVCNQ